MKFTLSSQTHSEFYGVLVASAVKNLSKTKLNVWQFVFRVLGVGKTIRDPQSGNGFSIYEHMAQTLGENLHQKSYIVFLQENILKSYLLFFFKYNNIQNDIFCYKTQQIK